jgi:hypothetical protein
MFTQIEINPLQPNRLQHKIPLSSGIGVFIAKIASNCGTVAPVTPVCQ